MNFTLEISQVFVEQLDELSKETRRILKTKLQLLKINPYRYKRIQGQGVILFRIRFSDNRKEKRLIYTIDKSKVELLCILDRDKDYKDLKRYLERVGY